MFCILVLLIWRLMWLVFLRGGSTTPFISRGQGYNEGSQVGYNMITIRLYLYLSNACHSPLESSGWWAES
jgi:hypothetical protein